MATPPRQMRLTMDAFPDCPQEFRGTLERLLSLLNESQTAVASALNRQLTRAENMRGGYVTASGQPDGGGILRAQTRNPLTTTPRAVIGVRLIRSDGMETGTWGLASWRTLGDGMLEVVVRGLSPSLSYTLTCIVE